MSQHPQPGQPYGQGPVPWQQGGPWGAQSGPVPQGPVVNPWSPQPSPGPTVPQPVGSAPPAAPPLAPSAAPTQVHRLGSVALAMALLAVLLVPLPSGWYGSAIAGSTDYLPLLEATIDEALRTRLIVPVLGVGSVLGLVALVLGVAAVVTRRERGRGAVATVVAVLLPGLSFLGYLVGILATGVR